MMRRIEHEGERIETGVVQFGENDWPGVFIRGDNAASYRIALGAALGMLPKLKSREELVLLPLRSLYRLLGECEVIG